MNTIQINGSYSMIKKFIQEGGIIFSNTELDKAIKLYINYQISSDVKRNTIVRKSGIAYLFFRYLQTRDLSLKSLTKENIYDFLNDLIKINWKISYIDRQKYDFKVFLNWLFQNNIINISGDSILPRINWHERTNIKTYYSKDEVISLINAMDIKTNDGKEDFLIISFICYLGLRISDIVNLKINNIDFQQNKIKIIQYKTKELLSLPLIDEVKYPLIDYLKNVRPQDADIDYIFITTEKPYRHKEWLRRKSRMVEKYLKKAGVNINGRKHGFHALRFSFSTMLLNENNSLYSISTILGHQNTKTTMTYLDIDVSKLKDLALEVPYVEVL